jgi:ABC-type xylose transport system permease subunit
MAMPRWLNRILTVICILAGIGFFGGKLLESARPDLSEVARVLQLSGFLAFVVALVVVITTFLWDLHSQYRRATHDRLRSTYGPLMHRLIVSSCASALGFAVVNGFWSVTAHVLVIFLLLHLYMTLWLSEQP